MPTIQSSIGLVTGLPITDTVDQLISISAQPRDRLQERTAALKQQQVAVSELTALTVGIQLAARNLDSETIFDKMMATSSNRDVLAADVTGDAVPGTYQFMPVRMAQNHQVITSGVAALDQQLGGGALSVRFGGAVDSGVDLESLNGGAGVERGRIRITDRSGASQVIDLRFALTIDDVLEQINTADQINVQAVADGDAIRLTDQTGLDAANLRVQEIGVGRTAADLGLGGINAATSEVTGQSLVRLYDRMSIAQLNDGNGLSIRDELPDLVVNFQDGSTLDIDLQKAEISSVGDLLDALNTADPARLQAAISADGSRLVVTDLTTGGATFSVTSAVGGSLAEDLGLTGPAAGSVITGNRLLGGLKGPLLSSLSGGQGLGSLGLLDLTDRSGASASVDLSTAETLADVVNLINDAGVEIRASINGARSGIQLTDTTGLTSANLIVANGDTTNTADRLGLTIDAATSVVDGGSLNLQFINENTRLDTLNNGAGVELGSILITDTTGAESGINLLTSEAETVGDVLDLINGMGLAVEARINDSGDGIVLIDTAGGAGTLQVAEAGSRNTAADLRILGEATTVSLEGTPTQVIDGATTQTISFASDDTIEDVVTKINAMDLGVTASIFDTGSGSTPYRISLVSTANGSAGEMLLDSSQFGLSFYEIVSAKDAVLQVGSSDVPGAGVLVTSTSNRFEDVVGGVELTINDISNSPVTVTVDSTDSELLSNVNLFVDQYNKLRDKLDELTSFDDNTMVTGLLFGTNEALQIESRLTRVLTDRFFGVGSIQSLEQLGISLDQEGRLELDETKLQEAFADDPDAVQQFFTDENYGFAARLDAVVESLAGEGNSLLLSRNDVLQRRIDEYTDKIDFYNQRLASERERLLKYYYSTELAISKIQSNLSAIQSLSPLPPMTAGISSNSLS